MVMFDLKHEKTNPGEFRSCWKVGFIYVMKAIGPLIRQQAFWSVPGFVLPGASDGEGTLVCWYWALRSSLVKGREFPFGGVSIGTSKSIMLCKGWVSTLSMFPMFRTGVGTGTWRPATKKGQIQIVYGHVGCQFQTYMRWIGFADYTFNLPTSLLMKIFSFFFWFSPAEGPFMSWDFSATICSRSAFFLAFSLITKGHYEVYGSKNDRITPPFDQWMSEGTGRKQFWKQHLTWTVNCRELEFRPPLLQTFPCHLQLLLHGLNMNISLGICTLKVCDTCQMQIWKLEDWIPQKSLWFKKNAAIYILSWRANGGLMGLSKLYPVSPNPLTQTLPMVVSLKQWVSRFQQL